MNIKKLTTEYVEWADSQGVTPGWLDLSDFEPTLPVMKSVGWVVHEDKKMLSLCGNIAAETKSTLFQGNGIITIPKKCILKRKKIIV